MSRCHSSPTFQGLTPPHLHGATDSLVKPKLMNRYPAVWCVDLCSARVRVGIRAPLIIGSSQEVIAPGLSIAGCVERSSILFNGCRA
jgi:hypothetical protein